MAQKPKAKTKKRPGSKAARRQRRQRQVIIAAAVVILAIGLTLFLLRGQIKNAHYSHKATAAFNAEMQAMHNPLVSTFGLAYQNTTCQHQAIAGYTKPQLQCIASGKAYTVIGPDKVRKVYFVFQADALDKLLKQNGWTVDKNVTPTIKQWFQGFTAGKDWYPDEGAYKNSGNVHCGMDFFVASSHHKPPAFTLIMNCTAPALPQLATLPS